MTDWHTVLMTGRWIWYDWLGTGDDWLTVSGILFWWQADGFQLKVEWLASTEVAYLLTFRTSKRVANGSRWCDPVLLLLEPSDQWGDVGDPSRLHTVPAAVQGVWGTHCQNPKRQTAEDEGKKREEEVGICFVLILCVCVYVRAPVCVCAHVCNWRTHCQNPQRHNLHSVKETKREEKVDVKYYFI